MAINLLETLKSKLGYALAEHSANFFGEEQANTGKAVDGTFAAILAGMIQRVSYDKGAKDLHKILKKESYRDYDIEDIFTRSPQTVNGLVNRGQHFLPSIYPGKLREATNSVAADSGVKKVTSSKMMKICAPMLLSTLAKEVQEGNLDINGMKSLLNAQKSAVESGVPKGFIEEAELSAFGWTKKEVVVEEKPKKVKKEKKEKVVKEAVVEKAAEKKIPVTDAVAPVGQAASSGFSFLKWAIPFLLILLGLWYLLTRVMGCGAVTDKVATTVAAPVEKVTEVVKEAPAAITNVFGKVNNAAMGALNSIKFAAGSAGDQMMSFIKGGASGDGRFRFNNLNFASGSAVIDGESGLEVDNLSAILKAYEDVKVSIEGYTDSKGNPDSNVTLSQQRAEAVRTRLIAAGIADSRITTQGFGAANPVADNETAEGRAQNRRIEVVIVK